MMEESTTALIAILRHWVELQVITTRELDLILSATSPVDLAQDLNMALASPQERRASRTAFNRLTKQNLDWHRIKSEAARLLRAARAVERAREGAAAETLPIPAAVEAPYVEPGGDVLNWFAGGTGKASLIAFLCRSNDKGRYLTARRVDDLGSPEPWPRISVDSSCRPYLQHAVAFRRSIWIPAFDSARKSWIVLGIPAKLPLTVQLEPSAELVGLVHNGKTLLLVGCSSRGGHVAEVGIHDLWNAANDAVLKIESFRVRRILAVVATPDRRINAICDSRDRTRIVQLVGPVTPSAKRR